MWRGSAAVELLAHDAEDWALLLRRAHPGTTLLATPGSPEQQIDACVGVLANLHRAPIADLGVPILREVAHYWVTLASERASRWMSLLGDRVAIVSRGIEQLRAFAGDDAPTVLLHGDLNPGNILLDDPGTPHWLAIDPKPMLGDPAYELWPVLNQIDDPFGHPDPQAVLLPRLLRSSQALGLPPQRVALWGLARTVESVLWQLETWPTPERQAAALVQLAEAQTWADIADTLGPA
jgi:streptomycin 6-kinase